MDFPSQAIEFYYFSYLFKKYKCFKALLAYNEVLMLLAFSVLIHMYRLFWAAQLIFVDNKQKYGLYC